METDRQVAAICVARLFQGMGHHIRKEGDSTVAYLGDGKSQITDYEKNLLKEAYDFFLGLIKGERQE